ncbi:efflux RND transporter periplasmic adaptor subunit [Pseudoalteromonas sp. G4]|uniref:efflux RND transporter periplasmic adaptor subunit n=1 Tax=Pseudoalteromonas sp. G4 TaxID=2992761 RepID=UPI00237ECA27|nr:efflux RND transporter periplasmic adaptor subunit [Pseudoalteromonas sp. G4]MDE3273397.1 efflux RND transporter periplasmic adaptor subunit [Pseudoalteromonas sp. G4]
MKALLVKIFIPIGIIIFGMVGFSLIKASAADDGDKKPVDTRPTVSVKALKAVEHQVVLTSFGEVKPLETTRLAAQVSGEVISWHKNFVAGGLVKRGEVLFTIEKDNYLAALLQAEAALTSAQAVLIEEQAKAQVAEDEAKRFPNKPRTDLFLRKPQVLSAQAQVKSAQAALMRAQRDLEDCAVKAPYDALIISREIGVGQFVNKGTQVAQLNNIETAEIILPIAGFDSLFLPTPLAETPVNISYKGINSFVRQGKISRDLGVIDSATRMSHIVVQVDDPYNLKSSGSDLKFGKYVEVSFAGKQLSEVFKLPQELVNNRTVWVVDNEQKLQAKEVNVLRSEGAYFLIDKGLANDEQLVLTLPEYPQVGMEVKLAASNASDGLK